MKTWDHFDIIVTVGVCATILCAGVFFFALGGTPTGLWDQRLESAAPGVIDQDGLAQTALGQAVMASVQLRNVEGGVVVGHDHGGVARQRRQQPSRCSVSRLDVREVPDAERRTTGGIVGHPLDHEPVQPIAGPAVARAQGFEHEQWPSERSSPGNRAVEREAPRRTSRRNHPIEDKRPVRTDGVISDQSGAILCDLGHNG